MTKITFSSIFVFRGLIGVVRRGHSWTEDAEVPLSCPFNHLRVRSFSIYSLKYFCFPRNYGNNCDFWPRDNYNEEKVTGTCIFAISPTSIHFFSSGWQTVTHQRIQSSYIIQTFIPFDFLIFFFSNKNRTLFRCRIWLMWLHLWISCPVTAKLRKVVVTTFEMNAKWLREKMLPLTVNHVLRFVFVQVYFTLISACKCYNLSDDHSLFEQE